MSCRGSRLGAARPVSHEQDECGRTRRSHGCGTSEPWLVSTESLSRSSKSLTLSSRSPLEGRKSVPAAWREGKPGLCGLRLASTSCSVQEQAEPHTGQRPQGDDHQKFEAGPHGTLMGVAGFDRSQHQGGERCEAIRPPSGLW